MIENRRHLRYRPENTHAARARLLGVTARRDSRPVLIADLSYSGCNLIAMGQSSEVAPGDDVTLELEADDSVDVEVVRVEQLTVRAIRIGCRFLE